MVRWRGKPPLLISFCKLDSDDDASSPPPLLRRPFSIHHRRPMLHLEFMILFILLMLSLKIPLSPLPSTSDVSSPPFLRRRLPRLRDDLLVHLLRRPYGVVATDRKNERHALEAVGSGAAESKAAVFHNGWISMGKEMKKSAQPDPRFLLLRAKISTVWGSGGGGSRRAKI